MAPAVSCFYITTPAIACYAARHHHEQYGRCVSQFNWLRLMFISSLTHEMDAKTEFVVRKAKREDCSEIRRLIQELADFEKMPDGPKINAKDLERDGFDRVPALFRCLVVEASCGLLVGYVLCYDSYSTWRGASLYMEDLYVTPSHRNTGLGRSLFAAAAKEAVDTGCARLDFAVLSWNPAQKFYASLGAKNMTDAEGWTCFRVQDAALEALAGLA